eukprot:TRINITY_DN12099_c0_g1_i1.p1 TRINITY_DN12099_c0_g1~~TRINITY_DN12099_c0_g1_i1.p1  ORF type:complete len:600 (+),score=184.40 TRINITY_DN12099_c0_g1_i1:152-1951(+)
MDSSPGDETKPILATGDEAESPPNYRGFKAKWKGREFRSTPDSASKLKAAKDAWRQSYGATTELTGDYSPGVEMRNLSGSSVEDFRAVRDEQLGSDNKDSALSSPVIQADRKQAAPNSPGEEEEEGDGFDRKHHPHDRLLTFYQVGLIVLVLVVWWSAMLMNHDMFDVRQGEYGLTPPALKEHNVETFQAAFQIPKTAKKGAAQPDPDLIYLLTPGVQSWFGGEEGSWVWSHGELYLMMPTAFLHAVSGTLMDPAYSTTEPPVEHPKMPQCFRAPHGTEDRLKCVEAFVGPLVDPKEAPKGGYFAFVTRHKMHIFHYETADGTSRFKPVEQSDIWKYTLMMVGTCVAVSLIGATSITVGLAYMAQHVHKEYLKAYISKALFMHDVHHRALYDQILLEVHDEHHAEEAANAEHLDPEDHVDMHDDHPAVATAQKKIEKKLRHKIYETQGVLHVVSEYARGGKSRKAGANPDLAAMAEPSLCSKLLERTQETLAHVLIMIVTCAPILVCNVLFKQGLVQFGSFAVDSGMLPNHTVVYYLHLFMLIASLICWILLCSLIFHYLCQEFGEGHPGTVWHSFSHNPAVHFFFTTWTGFSLSLIHI